MKNSFNSLKDAMTCPPVLSFPDFDKAFVVETDASAVAIGAVFAQKKEEGKIHPVQLPSRTMNV